MTSRRSGTQRSGIAWIQSINLKGKHFHRQSIDRQQCALTFSDVPHSKNVGRMGKAFTLCQMKTSSWSLVVSVKKTSPLVVQESSLVSLFFLVHVISMRFTTILRRGLLRTIFRRVTPSLSGQFNSSAILMKLSSVFRNLREIIDGRRYADLFVVCAHSCQ